MVFKSKKIAQEMAKKMKKILIAILVISIIAGCKNKPNTTWNDSGGIYKQRESKDYIHPEITEEFFGIHIDSPNYVNRFVIEPTKEPSNVNFTKIQEVMNSEIHAFATINYTKKSVEFRVGNRSKVPISVNYFLIRPLAIQEDGTTYILKDSEEQKITNSDNESYLNPNSAQDYTYDLPIKNVKMLVLKIGFTTTIYLKKIPIIKDKDKKQKIGNTQK